MPRRQGQNKMVGIKGFQSLLENCSRILSGTISSALILVLSSLILGAQFSWAASIQRCRQRHHWSPATKPGNWYSGLGVMRSFPLARLNCKNSSLTMAQTRWLPTSSELVLQQPSRKKPVRGSKEQGTKGCPKTFNATSFCIQAFLKSGHTSLLNKA